MISVVGNEPRKAVLRLGLIEHWRPVATPVKQRRKADFISRVDKAFYSSLPRLSRLCLNLCLRKSRPVKLSTYVMLCLPTSERWPLRAVPDVPK
jgi:hypothetical protein